MSALSIAIGLHADDHAGFRQPAEFEPQAAIWLSASLDNPDFMRVTTDLVTALQPQVTVKMLLEDDATMAKARDELKRKGIKTEAIKFVVDPLATYMMRDSAVFLTNGKGDLAVLDLKWSDYGLPGWAKQVSPTDPKREARIVGYLNTAQDGNDRSIAKACGAAVVASPLYLENACFEVNGQGVMLICESLALERNPGLGRAEIETALRRIPGITKVIWLAEGLAEDPLERSTITGRYIGMGAFGHTDEFVRFADASTILLCWPDEAPGDVHPVTRLNRERLQRNYDILAQATDQAGRPFRIVKVPMPNLIEKKVKLLGKDEQVEGWYDFHFPESEGRKAGDELIQVASASYLNLIIANQLVLVPSYVEDGTPATVQERVRRILAAAFPGRTIQFIHATALNWHGGGPHCATLSEPRR